MENNSLSLSQRLRIRLGIFLINMAATALPKGYNDLHFVKNCTYTNIIKLDKNE